MILTRTLPWRAFLTRGERASQPHIGDGGSSGVRNSRAAPQNRKDRLLAESPGGPAPGKPGRPDGSDPLTAFDPAKIEPDLRARTRINLRPIGSPLPLGFFTVAIDNVLVSALQWGSLSAADGRAVALIVFPAFIIQAIVGVLALSARDSIAGTLMLSFATTWLADALVFYVNPPGAAAALGIFYIVFAVFIALMLASALLKRALAAVLAVATPRFLIAGIAELTGNHVLAQTAAILGFLLAAVAMYTAFALLLEDSRGREVLPIGRLGAARQATHGTLADELRDIERQAGVRRTL
jgi:succinate-acetate transporter protein